MNSAYDFRLGDCLGIDGLPALADGAVDVTITDPPFDGRAHIAAVERGDWRHGKREVKGALPFAAITAAQIAGFAHHIVRTTRRWIVVFTAERQLELWAAALEMASARVIRFGIARRKNPRPQMSGDRPAPAVDHLVIAHPGKGRMRWNGRGRPASWDTSVARHDPGGKVHPTQKALGLMRDLVADFSESGELVCDPFAGAGTTAVACKELGRRFLGWEISAEYHAAAFARLERTQPQQLGFGILSHAP